MGERGMAIAEQLVTFPGDACRQMDVPYTAGERTEGALRILSELYEVRQVNGQAEVRVARGDAVEEIDGLARRADELAGRASPGERLDADADRRARRGR